MISFGRSITSASDELQKIPLKTICNAIRKPKQETINRIKQLRIVRDLDKKQYAFLKRQLPYFVCAIFNPAFRKSENFAYIEYFVVDIDHISEKDIPLSQLKQTIIKDSRVVCCFTSPSEDGLKVVFRLAERCYDLGLYATFYKFFVTDFSKQYDLQQVVDTRTCDATRACFISFDPEIYYNERATFVNLKNFIDEDNRDVSINKINFINKQEQKQIKSEPNIKKVNDPDIETLQHIKSLLNPSLVKKNKDVYVPEILHNFIDEVKAEIESVGVKVDEIVNISYGKKIRMSLGLKRSEINIFHGKKGFSVLVSPRTGTNKELNELMVDFVKNYISSR